MKKLIIMSALVMGGLGINNASAQLGFRINVNLGTRPVYVPAPRPVEVVEQPVYDDDYYYLPDLEAYYSVGEHSYYYQDGENWVSAAYLPGMYRDFDWRAAKHYEIHSSRPYMHNDVYSARFGGFADRDSYYARAFPERGRYDNRYAYRGHDEYNSRSREQYDNRGGYDRNEGRGQNSYSQSSQSRNQGAYSQPAQPQNNSYNQPSQGRNQNGYNQPAQPAQQQSGYNRPSQGSNNGNNQPSQGQAQQGGRNNGQSQGGSNSQPANHSGGQNSGAAYSGDHYAANKSDSYRMGVVQDRAEFARPIRNN